MKGNHKENLAIAALKEAEEFSKGLLAKRGARDTMYHDLNTSEDRRRFLRYFAQVEPDDQMENLFATELLRVLSKENFNVKNEGFSNEMTADKAAVRKKLAMLRSSVRSQIMAAEEGPSPTPGKSMVSKAGSYVGKTGELLARGAQRGLIRASARQLGDVLHQPLVTALAAAGGSGDNLLAGAAAFLSTDVGKSLLLLAFSSAGGQHIPVPAALEPLRDVLMEEMAVESCAVLEHKVMGVVAKPMVEVLNQFAASTGSHLLALSEDTKLLEAVEAQKQVDGTEA